MSFADNASTAAAKFSSLPLTRQIGLLIGLALSIALGILVAVWSREPDMLPLVSQTSARDAADIVDVLQRTGIHFKIDSNQNTILVPKDVISMARMRLAQEGLPRENNATSALFEQSGAFGSSQFLENARYKQALESELARTISQFHDIKSARVHLALPRESVFVRDNRTPSASVFIDVYSGYELKKQTIASIVNLVASSVPELVANRVTVVDQGGQLLSEGSGQNILNATDRFMDYRQDLEHQYAQKIQDMLTPVLGYGRVKAKVSADIDFTVFEETQEKFNPNDPSIRSEQKLQEKKVVGSNAGGVPGTISNQPPQGNTQGQQGGASPQSTEQSKNQSGESTTLSTGPEMGADDVKMQSTKNFELDKTISHTQKQPGTIKRLTVAVLVDYKKTVDPKTKKETFKPLSKKEIDEIKTLVSDSIGINIKRGDSLNVISSHFVKPDPIEPQPEEKIWQSPWFWSIVKQVGGALFLLLLIFAVLRPMFKNLSSGSKAGGSGDGGEKGTAEERQAMLEHLGDFEQQMVLLKKLVEKDPKKVAQVVKSWVEKG